MPRSNTLPVRISWPAAATFSGVMKLTVPRWSSLPHRPQLLRRWPISRKSTMCVSSSRRRAAARPQRSGFYFPIDRSASDDYRARPMSRPEVLSIASELALEPVAPDVYVGASALEEGRVFGGLMIAHALRAAHATVPDGRLAHSLQCAFVRAGRNDESLRYEVERTHEGASFSTRRVVVHQAGAVAFVLTARFQVPEDGPEYQPADPPPDGDPETLPVGRYDSPWFESRDLGPDAP